MAVRPPPAAAPPAKPPRAAPKAAREAGAPRPTPGAPPVGQLRCTMSVPWCSRNAILETYGEVAGHATRVTASAGGSTTNPQCWAIGLNVADALAMVALFRVGRAWERALIRFVTFINHQMMSSSPLYDRRVPACLPEESMQLVAC